MVFRRREFAKHTATPMLLIVLVVCVFAANRKPTAAQDLYQKDRRPTYRQRENDRRLEGQLKQQHFKSGAQRSELILQEISQTLKSIDERFERLEKLAELRIQSDPTMRSTIHGSVRK